MSYTEAWACHDCTLYAAGHSAAEIGEEYPAEVVDGMAGIRASVEDERVEFTWERCPMCWRDQGGSRQKLTITEGN